MCNTSQKKTYPEEDNILDKPAITASMTIMGNIVNRLANNSNICKTVTVTLTGLILGLNAGMTLGSLICVLICIVAIFYQDCLYCTLKKGVTDVSKGLRDAAEKNDFSEYQPFVIPKTDSSLKAVLKNWNSKSILPFYGPIVFILVISFIYKHGICNICEWVHQNIAN